MNQNHHEKPWFREYLLRFFCNHRRVSQLEVEGMFCLTSTSAVGGGVTSTGTFGSDLLESREWRIDRARRWGEKKSLGDFKETMTMPTLPFPRNTRTHSWKRTAESQTWRFGSDDFRFQIGDFLVPPVSFLGSKALSEVILRGSRWWIIPEAYLSLWNGGLALEGEWIPQRRFGSFLMVFNLIEVFFWRNIFHRFQGCLGWCKLPSS